jgi:hypothetical protein
MWWIKTTDIMSQGAKESQDKAELCHIIHFKTRLLMA